MSIIFPDPKHSIHVHGHQAEVVGSTSAKVGMRSSEQPESRTRKHSSAEVRKKRSTFPFDCGWQGLVSQCAISRFCRPAGSAFVVRDYTHSASRRSGHCRSSPTRCVTAKPATTCSRKETASGPERLGRMHATASRLKSSTAA
jgi:hypothetical protein